jgi:hypothetical protein
MKPLTGQRKSVYEYIRDNPACTVEAVRRATNATKADMRISEINFEYRKEHGEDLIVNVGKNQYRQVLKSVKTPITKQIQHIEIVNNIAVRTYETVAI